MQLTARGVEMNWKLVKASKDVDCMYHIICEDSVMEGELCLENTSDWGEMVVTIACCLHCASEMEFING